MNRRRFFKLLGMAAIGAMLPKKSKSTQRVEKGIVNMHLDDVALNLPQVSYRFVYGVNVRGDSPLSFRVIPAEETGM